tara:strand:- start:456 stop:764 length:309 start_codon:yes stop_codon:yes gene_type:complete
MTKKQAINNELDFYRYIIDELPAYIVHLKLVDHIAKFGGGNLLCVPCQEIYTPQYQSFINYSRKLKDIKYPNENLYSVIEKMSDSGIGTLEIGKSLGIHQPP